MSRVPNIRIYEVGISYYGRSYAEGKNRCEGWFSGDLLHFKIQFVGEVRTSPRYAPNRIRSAPVPRTRQIATHDSWSSDERVRALAGLMERLFFEATRREQIAFSTLFARISYAGHLFRIQPEVLQTIHRFRLAAKKTGNGRPADEQTVGLGLRAVAKAVLVLTGAAIPQEVLETWGDTDGVS